MNTLSINSPQPSFKGVRIYPDVNTLRRKATPLVFQIVPNSDFKGIEIGDRLIKSDAANTMTKLFADTEFKNQLWLNPFTRRFRKLINRIINQIGLRSLDKEFLFDFIKDKKMTVETTSRPDDFRLKFHENRQPIELNLPNKKNETTYSLNDLKAFGYSNERRFPTESANQPAV